MLLIFLDTETTGLNPEIHRAIEIAYKVVDHQTNEVIVSYQSIITQSREVWASADSSSLAINGFTFEELLQGKSEKTVASDIMSDFNRSQLAHKGGVFICQNPSFDRIFFNKLISPDLQNNSHWPYHWLDLASMYWAFAHLINQKITEEKELSKNNIALKFNLPEENLPHRAMNGVEHLMKCYQALFSHHIIEK